MSGFEAAVAGAALAALTAFAIAGAVAWCGPVDPVKGRSSHARPTPTSGGLGVIAGAAAGMALAATLGGWRAEDREPLAALLALAATAGLFGAADDRLDLDAKLKLAVLAALALAASCGVAHVTTLALWPGLTLPLGSPLGALGGALFLVVLLNAVNFMDGSNGLAGGAAAISLTTLAAAAFLGGQPAVGAAALAAAGANAGFLPWNLTGRVFQGDAGALFSALTIGGVGLVLATWGTATPYLVVFTVLPLITDVLLTLLARARRRAPLLQAHREHLYQLWLDAAGGSHAALAARVWALTAATSALGLVLELHAPQWTFAGLAATIAALGLGWTMQRRRLELRSRG